MEKEEVKEVMRIKWFVDRSIRSCIERDRLYRRRVRSKYRTAETPSGV